MAFFAACPVNLGSGDGNLVPNKFICGMADNPFDNLAPNEFTCEPRQAAEIRCQSLARDENWLTIVNDG